MTDPAHIIETAGQALGLLGRIIDMSDRLRQTPERQAAGLRRRARRRRRAATRALTANGKQRKLDRAMDLEARASLLDPR